ncbi:MAG: hypothetical protein GY756_23655, partial [bacterium]|nr:hypothetical protein [bacterium]
EKLWRNWWEDNKQRFEPGKHYCYGYEVKNKMSTDEGKELMQHYDKKCDNIDQIYAKLKKGEFDEYKKMLIYLNDKYEGIWEYAFELLKEVGLSQSIDLFISFLEDNNSLKRANALYGLRNIAIVNKVVPHILIGLKDNDRVVKLAAEDVLIHLLKPVDTPSFKYEDWLQWWNANSDQFEQDIPYYEGKIFSIKELQKDLIEDMKEHGVVVCRYHEIFESWTGQNFGDEKTPDIISKWEQWWQENKDRFEPGKRYFYGHLVP